MNALSALLNALRKNSPGVMPYYENRSMNQYTTNYPIGYTYEGPPQSSPLYAGVPNNDNQPMIRQVLDAMRRDGNPLSPQTASDLEQGGDIVKANLEQAVGRGSATADVIDMLPTKPSQVGALFILGNLLSKLGGGSMPKGWSSSPANPASPNSPFNIANPSSPMNPMNWPK